MEEWYAFNEEKIKVISLITAMIVLMVSIYRWLIQKWRHDVDLRKYAYFTPLITRNIEARLKLSIEVPTLQHILLTLESETGSSETLYDGQAPVGKLIVPLDMSEKCAGNYSLIMQCDDQNAMKKIFWSGLDSVQ